MRKFSYLTVVLTVVLLCACSGGGAIHEPASPESGSLTISFNFDRQSGWASNQFAVWIEDMNGNYINTLYATRWTANGGFATRPDSIHQWVEASGVAHMPQSEVDSVSGATPASGELSYAWDLTDKNGDMVERGEYRFFVEGSLRWRNRVLYTGIVDLGGGEATVMGNLEFIFEASGSNAALSNDASEMSMITEVVAVWIP